MNYFGWVKTTRKKRRASYHTQSTFEWALATRAHLQQLNTRPPASESLTRPGSKCLVKMMQNAGSAIANSSMATKRNGCSDPNLSWRIAEQPPHWFKSAACACLFRIIFLSSLCCEPKKQHISLSKRRYMWKVFSKQANNDRVQPKQLHIGSGTSKYKKGQGKSRNLKAADHIRNTRRHGPCLAWGGAGIPRWRKIAPASSEQQVRVSCRACHETKFTLEGESWGEGPFMCQKTLTDMRFVRRMVS